MIPLLWPLFIAGAIEDVPDALHLWAIDRLEYIGSITGIALAASLAKLLMNAKPPSPRDPPVDSNGWCYKDIDQGNGAEEVVSSKGWKPFLNS